MKKIDNVILIGMPGCGKTTIGRLLANELNYHFLDTDQYIEQQTQKSLQQILDKEGIEGFCNIEKDCIISLLPLEHYVIAPGGSVIYSEELINTLKENSLIIFLLASLNAIQLRLKNKETRGIVGLKEKSLGKLYEERQPLYMKHADIIISCDDESPAKIVEEIKKNKEIRDILEK